MDDDKNTSTAGESSFAQDRAGATAAAPALAKETAPDYLKAGEILTDWLNARLSKTPGVTLVEGSRNYTVRELLPSGEFSCVERGTEVKHVIPADERTIGLILAQVMKD